MPENTMCSLVLEAKILATVSLATSLMLSVTKEFTTSLMMASFKVERKSHMHFSRQFKKELVHILHCIKRNNRFVLPVSFNVDPSDIRHLKNSFGEVMTKLENKYKNVMNKVDTWKKALKEVASLSGHHFKDGHRYEHEIIKNIVEDISIKIGRLPLPVADFPVGLEFPVSKVISLLEMDSTDQVHMERIHGIGGIGKITLALALYNLIADNFEGVCFLENLRETSQKYGLVHLQNNLFCKMLGKEGVKIIGVKEGISQIQRRLSQIKVLLILDDIDEHE
ncbi:hypothetical protein HN51_071222 [Arachis hypogaea]